MTPRILLSWNSSKAEPEIRTCVTVFIQVTPGSAMRKGVQGEKKANRWSPGHPRGLQPGDWKSTLENREWAPAVSLTAHKHNLLQLEFECMPSLCLETISMLSQTTVFISWLSPWLDGSTWLLPSASPVLSPWADRGRGICYSMVKSPKFTSPFKGEVALSLRLQFIKFNWRSFWKLWYSLVENTMLLAEDHITWIYFIPNVNQNDFKEYDSMMKLLTWTCKHTYQFNVIDFSWVSTNICLLIIINLLSTGIC